MGRTVLSRQLVQEALAQGTGVIRMELVNGSVITTRLTGEVLHGTADSVPPPRRAFRIGKPMMSCKPSFEQDLICDCGNLWPYCTCNRPRVGFTRTDRTVASLNGHMVRL